MDDAAEHLGELGQHTDLAPLRLGELLKLDELAAAEPALLSRPDPGWASRAVQWVHIAGDHSAASLLEGGELVLSTGQGFRDSAEATEQFLGELERAGAVCLLMELLDPRDRPLDDAIRILTAAAAQRSLPVLLVSQRVRFARLTQIAYRHLVDQQLARVQRINDIHDVFTRLSLEGADEQRILDEAGELLGAPVVLEDLRGRVLGFHADTTPAAELLRDWSARSRHETYLERTGRSRAGAPWLQSPVGARGRRWGRLVLPGATDDDRTAAHILERAGQTLTLSRMAEQDQQDLLLHAREGLVQALRPPGRVDEDEARTRARSLGVTATSPCATLAARLPELPDEPPTGLQRRERSLRQSLSAAAEASGRSALIAHLRPGMLGVILPVDDRAGLETFIAALEVPSAADHRFVLGTSGIASTLTGAAAGLDEAAYIADIAATLRRQDRILHRAEDARLHGLLALLGDDDRVQTFVRAELGPLLEPQHGELLAFLEEHLTQGGSKATTAEHLHLSRPAVYTRIRRIENLLGVSLSEPESLTSLHVAVLSHRLTRLLGT